MSGIGSVLSTGGSVWVIEPIGTGLNNIVCLSIKD